jgi:hypothetical protein
MMTTGSPADEHAAALERFFRRKPVARLDELRRILGASGRTVFRTLKRVGYRTSYSHAGGYYTLADVPRFDENGLWAHGGVLFSKEGTLRATVVQVVESSAAGHTHTELQARLRLRVHDTLRDLVEDRQLGRVELEQLYLYVSASADRAAMQVERRAQRGPEIAPPKEEDVLDPALVIEVLLEVIHGTVVRIDAQEVTSRLVARRVAITAAQVEEILRRHSVVKKTARSRSPRSRR